MTDDTCALCRGERVIGVVVSMPGDPHRETVDMPCRCTYAPPEPEPEPEPKELTPIESYLT